MPQIWKWVLKTLTKKLIELRIIFKAELTCQPCVGTGKAFLSFLLVPDGWRL